MMMCWNLIKAHGKSLGKNPPLGPDCSETSYFAFEFPECLCGVAPGFTAEVLLDCVTWTTAFVPQILNIR